jgi:hypothetical protein
VMRPVSPVSLLDKAYGMNTLSKKRRAAASSPTGTLDAMAQALMSAPAARGHPARNARRLGSRRAASHPGTAPNATAVYCARSAAGFAGGGHTGHGFSGSCAHPALSTIRRHSSRAMWVVYLEMLFALALAAFIIWFTWPRGK